MTTATIAPAGRIHLTLTGVAAGATLCGIRKDYPDHRFAHVRTFSATAPICPVCRELWENEDIDDIDEDGRVEYRVEGTQKGFVAYVTVRGKVVTIGRFTGTGGLDKIDRAYSAAKTFLRDAGSPE